MTPLPRWAGRLITCAAAASWAEAAYAACVAVTYGVTARQATWGGPLWWPVVVGAVAVAALCALGFAAGAMLPTRFAAPLAAMVTLVALFAALRPAGASTYALVSPVNSSVGLNLAPDTGIFSPYLLDLAIVQTMFLAGLGVAALAALGLPGRGTRPPGGSERQRLSAAALTAVGLAVAAAGVGLAGTATTDPHDRMKMIPALHDSADDQPIPYTPLCGRAAVPVCVHPAFRGYLPQVTAALGPVLSQVEGLPGAPARVGQAAETQPVSPAYTGAVLSGSPPVLRIALGAYAELSSPATRLIQVLAAPAIVSNVISGRNPHPGPAQQAVEAAILKAAGIPLAAPGAGQRFSLDGVPGPASGSPAYTAAMRYAALPSVTRRAWLRAHLIALRAGHITLAQLP